MNNEMAKVLNKLITGNSFEDKSTDDYIYASLSQPPIKILDKRNSDDELNYIVECPNCHSAVCYGTDTFMYSGHIYCSNKGCREQVVEKYDNSKKNLIYDVENGYGVLMRPVYMTLKEILHKYKRIIGVSDENN